MFLIDMPFYFLFCALTIPFTVDQITEHPRKWFAYFLVAQLFFFSTFLYVMDFLKYIGIYSNYHSRSEINSLMLKAICFSAIFVFGYLFINKRCENIIIKYGEKRYQYRVMDNILGLFFFFLPIALLISFDALKELLPFIPLFTTQ